MTTYQATVQAVGDFDVQLEQVAHAMARRQPDTAALRYAELLRSLQDVRARLSVSPYSSRSVQALQTPVQQLRARVGPLLELAKSLGLANLKEVPFSECVLLLAHSDKRVVFLAIKHTDDLNFRPQ